ncbi:hypothetical protein [Mucilaginibacter sp.]|uniref:hypothetical protein n=1 Tax=Mucilaginibacter sp. TaxID=1882438 RepID=UPI002625D1A3|nr:hypothetical protein [Mucilaginibacter sp.]
MNAFDKMYHRVQLRLNRSNRKKIISNKEFERKLFVQKTIMLWLGLFIAFFGITLTVLIYKFQVDDQKNQNSFEKKSQDDLQRFQKKLEQQKFEYTIIQKSSELPTFDAVAKNLDSYIKLKLISGEERHYEKLIENFKFDEIPFAHRKFVFISNFPGEEIFSICNTNDDCNIDSTNGNWRNVINAKPGDIVIVKIQLHNNSDQLSKTVAVGMNPKVTILDNNHVFRVVIAADNEYDRDSVFVKTDKSTILRFIPGSMHVTRGDKLLKAYSINDESYLFGRAGLNAGDIGAGLENRQRLVVSFKVSTY